MPFLQFSGNAAKLAELKAEGILDESGCLKNYPGETPLDFNSEKLTYEQVQARSHWYSMQPKQSFLISDIVTGKYSPLIYDEFPHRRLRALVDDPHFIPKEYTTRHYDIPDDYTIVRFVGMLNSPNIIELYNPVFWGPGDTKFSEALKDGAFYETERLLRLLGFTYTLFDVSWLCWLADNDEPVYCLQDISQDFADFPTDLTADLLEWAEIVCLRFEGLL